MNFIWTIASSSHAPRKVPESTAKIDPATRYGWVTLRPWHCVGSWSWGWSPAGHRPCGAAQKLLVPPPNITPLPNLYCLGVWRQELGVRWWPQPTPASSHRDTAQGLATLGWCILASHLHQIQGRQLALPLEPSPIISPSGAVTSPLAMRAGRSVPWLYWTVSVRLFTSCTAGQQREKHDWYISSVRVLKTTLTVHWALFG